MFETLNETIKDTKMTKILKKCNKSWRKATNTIKIEENDILTEYYQN